METKIPYREYSIMQRYQNGMCLMYTTDFDDTNPASSHDTTVSSNAS